MRGGPRRGDRHRRRPGGRLVTQTTSSECILPTRIAAPTEAAWCRAPAEAWSTATPTSVHRPVESARRAGLPAVARRERSPAVARHRCRHRSAERGDPGDRRATTVPRRRPLERLRRRGATSRGRRSRWSRDFATSMMSGHRSSVARARRRPPGRARGRCTACPPGTRHSRRAGWTASSCSPSSARCWET